MPYCRPVPDSDSPPLPARTVNEVNATIARGYHESFSWRTTRRWNDVRQRFSRSGPAAAPGPEASGDSAAGILEFAGVRTCSQSLQDVFVRLMTNGLGLSDYLEIGGADPIHYSNTYILEADLGWTGVAIELDPELAGRHVRARRNPCLIADATAVDYSALLDARSASHRLAYLSVDIDPAHQSLNSLARIPLGQFTFAVVTFEHDAYRVGSHVRRLSREILRHYGYQLVVGNVQNDGLPFEDWWVHPSLVPEDRWLPYVASDTDPRDLLKARRHQSGS